MEKRLELKKALEDSKNNRYNINKIKRELNELEYEFARSAQRTEAKQRHVLTPEQVSKLKAIPYGYGSHGYNIRIYDRP